MLSRAFLTTAFHRRVMTLLVLALTTTLTASAMSACGDDPVGPEVPTIVGTWDLIGFSDAGVEAQTSGSWTFRSDRTHSFEGTVTFPDEPPENISGVGTYEQTGTTL